MDAVYSWTNPFDTTFQAIGFTHETAEPASHAVMAALQAKTLGPICHPKHCRQTAKIKTFNRNGASNLSLDIVGLVFTKIIGNWERICYLSLPFLNYKYIPLERFGKYLYHSISSSILHLYSALKSSCPFAQAMVFTRRHLAPRRVPNSAAVEAPRSTDHHGPLRRPLHLMKAKT